MYGGGMLRKILYGGGYLKSALYRTVGNALKNLIKNCGLISYADMVVDGFMEDQVGHETRTSIKARYINDPGLKASIGLPNEPLTYLDADTKSDVAGTTDGSGDFTFPSAKVANIKIPSDSSEFWLQEGLGDTIGAYNSGRVAKLSASPTFIEVNDIPSQANQVGWSLSDGVNWFWDELLTNLVDINVIISNKSTTESVAYYSESPPSNWILATGFWNDNGEWIDTEPWID